MISIALISRYEEDRKAISALLAEQNDFRLASTGVDGFDALRAAMAQKPDIIIMDFSMGDIDSPDLAPIIKRNSPSTALIVLYSQDEQNAVDKALAAGISGCLLRQKGFDNLVSSVRSVYYGGLYISEAPKNQAFHNFCMSKGEDLRIAQNIFTPTELCIFNEIIFGHSDKEIAKNLNMSIGSLRNCVNRVKHKTGLHNRTQITIYALLGGIINIGKIKDIFL